MEQDGAIVIRGPADVIGSEVCLVQNAEGLWNATLMGKQGGLEWRVHSRTDKTQAFIDGLATELKVPVGAVVRYEAPTAKGGGGVTWIHRRIALRFLANLSTNFMEF